MNAPLSVTAPPGEVTLTSVQHLARARGISDADFAAEAIRQALSDETDLMAFVQRGLDDIDAGRIYTQEQVEAWFEARYRDTAAE